MLRRSTLLIAWILLAALPAAAHLHQFPQVYAEIGLLQNTAFFPRAEYHAFLRRLAEAGFSDRILFGSDGPVEQGIDAVLEAEYLTDEQKRDILCHNAARFLRLNERVCAPR